MPLQLQDIRIQGNGKSLPTSSCTDEVRTILSQARVQVADRINEELVSAYWRIGRRLANGSPEVGNTELDEKTWVNNLSQALADHGEGAFHGASLQEMKTFYQTYPDFDEMHALCRGVPWSHHRIIMRLGQSQKRVFYLRVSAARHWSVKELERHINEKLYEQLPLDERIRLMTADPVHLGLPSIKSPYTQQFLGARQCSQASQREGRERVIEQVKEEILHAEKGFAYVSSNKICGADETVDLVFFNFLLKSFVLIKVQEQEIVRKDVERMNKCLQTFDTRESGAGQYPRIGLILSVSTEATDVKRCFPAKMDPAFEAKVRECVPSDEEIKEMLECICLSIEFENQ